MGPVADVLDVLAEHLGSEERALRLLGTLDHAGLQIIAKRTDTDVLAATEADLCGEPLLGPHQEALVHAITCRIHAGYPLGPADLAAVGHLGRVLGLPGIGP